MVAITLFLLPLFSISEDLNFKTLLDPNFTKFHEEHETFSYRENLKFDFLKSHSQEISPIVVSIHGGSWQGGNRTDLLGYDELFTEAGFHVVKMSYSFAPKHFFPSAVEDVCHLLETLENESKKMRIDMTKIVLFGRSAGGQIALSVPQKCRFKISAIISHYAPTDLVWGYQNSKWWHIIDGKKIISEYIGKDFLSSSQAYIEASPALHITPKFPPTFIAHGVNDELVSEKHAHFLFDALQKNRVPAELFLLPWSTHGFDFFWNGPSAQATFRKSLAFIKKYI